MKGRKKVMVTLGDNATGMLKQNKSGTNRGETKVGGCLKS